MWRNRFGGGFELVVRQNTECMNEHVFAVETVRVKTHHQNHAIILVSNLFSRKEEIITCRIWSGNGREIVVENKQVFTINDGNFNPNTLLIQL
jgi:hypothetical protein